MIPANKKIAFFIIPSRTDENGVQSSLWYTHNIYKKEFYETGILVIFVRTSSSCICRQRRTDDGFPALCRVSEGQLELGADDEIGPVVI